MSPQGIDDSVTLPEQVVLTEVCAYSVRVIRETQGKKTKQMKPSKITDASREGELRIQYAALPWRGGERPEIMLVSSLDTRRWIIPKGWPMKGRRPHAAAAREALEEAGLIGKIEKEAVGAYHYLKRTPAGQHLPCKVMVFPLDVTRQRRTWPERKQRTTRWFSAEEAAQAVDEPELKEIISGFARRLAPCTDA